MGSCCFSKYHGCGNDFILIDHRKEPFLIPDSAFIKRLCHRQFGIGADGLILLETSAQADFGMRIFNPDGSEAEMCGNGIRCLKLFIEDLGYTQAQCTISTVKRVVHVSRHHDLIAVDMGPASDIRWNLSLPLNQQQDLVGHYLNTGVPHLVIFVPDLERIPLLANGKALRHHPFFQPQGVNVNFVSFQNGRWGFRTYERGVEGETLACGTGATAVGLTLTQIKGVANPIELKTWSGDLLEVDSKDFSAVKLRGPATFVFQGRVIIG